MQQELHALIVKTKKVSKGRRETQKTVTKRDQLNFQTERATPVASLIVELESLEDGDRNQG